METWWARYPERLEHELQALDAAGIPYAPVRESIEAGIYRLRVTPTLDSGSVELIVTFPDSYPFFRFEIEAPGLSLEHHQHPFGKTLCLIGRATDEWHTTDTVAAFLQTRVQATLRAGQSEDRSEVAALEQHQAEPFSDYYPYKPAICHVDSAWVIKPEARFGSLTLGVIGLVTLPGEPAFLHAVVLEIRGERNELLATAETPIRNTFGRNKIFGRWSRAPDPIRSDDPETVFQKAAELDLTGRLDWAEYQQRRFQVRGVLFPEEVAWRRPGDGWVFVIRIQGPSTPLPQKPARKSDKRKVRWRPSPPTQSKAPGQDFYFARAGRAGRDDVVGRVPELRPLRDRRIAQFGAGCLGGPTALEFARAGLGELRILDDDIIDPATTVRWPLGLLVAGRLKVEVLNNLIREHYPYTDVKPMGYRLGAVRSGGPSESEVLALMTNGASLIYDATAEIGVQYFLSEYAREKGIPYIGVMGTQGGWGGSVVRVRPGVTEGCWSCLQAGWFDGSLPSPPFDPEGLLQPVGCANPTFTGANFELIQVAMQGVRLAVSTLCEDTEGGYPSIGWDVAIISLRTPEGNLIAPAVETFPLRRHPGCPACANR